MSGKWLTEKSRQGKSKRSPLNRNLLFAATAAGLIPRFPVRVCQKLGVAVPLAAILGVSFPPRFQGESPLDDKSH